MGSKGGQVLCPKGTLWDGSAGLSLIVLCSVIKAATKADQMVEPLLMSRPNSAQMTAIAAAYGMEIEFECGYLGRLRVDMENQVEILVLNLIKFQECMYYVIFFKGIIFIFPNPKCLIFSMISFFLG